MPTRLLTVKELAELLNLRESWIYDRTAGSGPELIPHIKFGRQVRFDPESEVFKAWLKAHGVVAQPRSLTA
jgi:excisionase family DNA binding protein